MQRAFINALNDIIEEDKDTIYLVADNGTDYDTFFMRDYPEQCFNVGISEQNMIGVAAGMAYANKTVFVSSNGPFLAYRAHEFIRNCVCLQNRNVKIAAFGSGLSISRLGPTHHATEDIAALRAIPNLLILSPCSPMDTTRIVKFAKEHKGPVYLRLGMSGEKELLVNNSEFVLGECPEIVSGRDVAIFATGSIVSEATTVAKELKNNAIDVAVHSVPTLSPIEDYSGLKTCLTKYKIVVSVEEHSVYGGLGGIISEVIAKNNLGVKLYQIGLNNVFAKGYGTLEDIRVTNGIDRQSLKELIIKECC